MTTPLRREHGNLLHRQLFLALREQIKRGVYPPGGGIPSEEVLCQSFGVSRITVRRAVADLVAEGWVEKRMGRGTFVKGAARERAAQPSQTFVDSLMQRSKQTQVKVLEVATRSPPADVAAQLEQPADEPALYTCRLRSAAGVPLIVIDAWVAKRLGVHVTAELLARHAISELLLREGVTFGAVTQELTAVAADPHVAGLLDVEVGAPLLCMVRVVCDDQGRPVMHLTAHLTSERSRIVLNLAAADLNTAREGNLVHDVGAAAVRTARKRGAPAR